MLFLETKRRDVRVLSLGRMIFFAIWKPLASSLSKTKGREGSQCCSEEAEGAAIVDQTDFPQFLATHSNN